MNITKL